MYKTIITYDDLKKLGACGRDRRKFRNLFPDGAKVTVSNYIKAEEAEMDLTWLLTSVVNGDDWDDYLNHRSALAQEYYTTDMTRERFDRERIKLDVKLIRQHWAPEEPF